MKRTLLLATLLLFSATVPQAQELGTKASKCPGFLGDGRRLLEVTSRSAKLELLETRQYPSGDISLRYAPRAA